MVEEERQDNFMSATNGPNGGLPPIPDPTLLTTQQLMREFTTLKELIFTRLDGMEETTKLLHSTIASAVGHRQSDPAFARVDRHSI
jgi:hypothetical protein